MVLLAAGTVHAQRTRTLHIVSTGDVHASWFDQPYVEGGKARTSLMSVSHYVDSLRKAVGRDNVLLLDAGDCLQGDNASYYYNYVATDKPHLFPRIAHYMKYDAMAIGNHDIEAGHPVYDKVAGELCGYGIPWLGGNVIRTSDGMPYFPTYAVFDRAGMKVLVLGFENPNIKAWLSEAQYEGMSFLSLVPYLQICVDIATEAFRPDVTIVVAHSAVGDGEGSSYESQGLDVFDDLTGVDVLICGHDHGRAVVTEEGKVLVDAGSRAGYVAHSTVMRGPDGRKSVGAEIVRLDKTRIDLRMRRRFRKEFRLVRDFTVREVGSFAMNLSTREAYTGMCDYLNLLHCVQLSVPEARLSFAAPLTYDGMVREGTVIFNDMFTIYPYENQLSVVNLSGSEIKSYLEASYDQWILKPGDHVLNIHRSGDGGRWSFAGRSYNFDSAGGLVYSVDVTKPYGERVSIEGLADGSAFDLDAMYPVAMTSYRANGGGGLIHSGAGLTKEQVEERTVARYPEIRNLVYDYVKAHGVITSAMLSERTVVGEWKFVPEDLAAPLLEADMKLLFRARSESF